MKLEYIKINDKEIKFNENIIYISASNNAGKSSLVYLLKFILGGKDNIDSKKNFFKDYKNSKQEKLIIEWKINNKEYKYNLKTNEIIKNNETKMNPKNYYSEMKNTFDVFGTNVNINNQIYLSDSEKLKKEKQVFFDNANESYNAFLIYKLLNNSDLIENPMYNYFSEIAKIKRLVKSTTDIKTKLSKDLKEKEVKEYSQIHDLYLELESLKKLNNEKPDEKIVEEIKKIVNDEKLIDEGIKFHKALVSDYNSIIKEEKENIKKEIKKISSTASDEVVNDIYKIYKNFIENSTVIKKQTKNEIEEKKKIFQTEDYKKFEKEFQILNDQIKNFIKEKFENLFKTEYKYENNFSIKKNKESFVFSLGALDSPGDGSRQVNYILFMLFLLLNQEKFNYFVVDTKYTNEIDDKILKLNEIILKELNGKEKKQIIFFIHPDSILNSEIKTEYQYTKDNPIFLKL